MAVEKPLWLLINLNRSGERLATMCDHLASYAIEFTRVPAVDGLELPASLPGISPDLYRRSHGRDLRVGEIGCYLSHLRAMDMFLASSADFAVVLEDDVALGPDVPRLVDQLTAAGAPDDWDLVKLEARHKSRSLSIRPLFGPYHLATMLLRTTGGAAYLLNRSAAQACLARLLPMRAPFDHAFDRDWALGIRGRAINPWPASSTKGKHPSNIETTPSRKVTGVAKLPALWWRTRTEVMRVISALWGKFVPARTLPAPRTDQILGRKLFDANKREIA